VRRGDVVPFKGRKDSQGREQQGRRYAVVLQTDALEHWSTVIVAPTSTTPLGAFFRPQVGIRGKQVYVIVDQVLAVDRTRLGRIAGNLSHSELDAVEDALRFVLGLD
jgi:mRNA interferase MazF